MILKAYLIVGVILFGLIGFGKIIMIIEDSKPVIREPWLPQIDLEKEQMEKVRNTRNYNYIKSAWSDEQKEQTENWADFLETLENRGYSIYDPEAEGIWEEFY